MKTIIYKGRLIHVTMEKPEQREYTAHGFSVALNNYRNHLESLWKSSTIHASKELMERFKDGEELPEGSYVLGVKHGDKIHYLKSNDIEWPKGSITAFPAVEEGSQDEMWRGLLLMISHDFALEHGMTDKEALDFAHSCGKAGRDNLIKYQSQYKLTKI